MTTSVQQQNGRTISGTVVDETNTPVIGANVVVVGTTNGNITDVDGKFSLSNVAANATLRVSYIGYLEQLVNTQGQNTLTIVLVEDSKTIDEVVVVGYGTQKKVNLTGSVSTVKYDQEMENRPITDVSQALQGKVSGVWATQFSGAPGSDGATIRIRGFGSISTTANPRDPNPLVLIDGIEGKMADVDPSAIESMTVLKDAASAAIYGSRAANGVILIETKKGEGDRVTLTYNGYAGISRLPGKFDIISNSAEYMELWNQANRNYKRAETFPADVIEAFRNGTDPYKYPNTDFQDEVYRSGAFSTSHTLSASIGSQSSKTFLSLSYMQNEGTMKQTSAERYSLNINNETQINKWLKLGARGRMQRRSNVQPYTIDQVTYQLSNGHPFATPYLQDGKTFGASQALYLSGPNAGKPIVDTRNPFPQLYNGQNLTENTMMRGNVYASAELLKGLVLSVNYSGEYTGNTQDRYNQANYAYTGLNGEGETKSLDYNTVLDVRRNNSTTFYSTFFTNLNFNRTFAKIHEISGVLGYQQEATTRKVQESRRKSPPKGDLHEVSSGTANIEGTGNTYNYRMMSYFGRVNYALMSKYLFEVNFRTDASSRFAKGHRWGYFPSLSLGWRLSEENFIKNLNIFDNLKLRASWGKLGNQDTGSRNNSDYYPYLTVLTQDFDRSYNFGNTIAPGAAVTALVDPNITWETTTTTDVGLDIGVLNNRLSFEGDYFYRKTTDILVQIPLPKLMGNMTAPFQNVGEVINKGVELSVNWQDRVKSKQFSYKVGANFTITDNKVIKYLPNSPDNTWLVREGYSFNELYGFIMEGVYQTDEEALEHMKNNSYKPTAGELRLKDINGDGKLDFEDKTSMGRTIPRYTFGLNASLTYKAFDLNLAFAGMAGFNMYNNNEWTQPLAASGGPIPVRWRNAWTPENHSNTIPKISIGDNWMRQPSTFWVVQDMAWMKLKNIQLGYLVPGNVSRKIGLQKLYVYVNATELFQISSKGYEGFDPERDSFISGTYHYPVPQSYTLGVNVSF
ncbi:SusC/RagA family TonB-linked outer membrane protein [Bacteroidia bacterium]|nr:SusC/RagA family TonB-linked outer membrane protein [Bacteroidia bacterium]